MDQPLRLTTADQARARIADIVLGNTSREARIGAVSLRPHQISAVARLETALEEFGGALLCDEVGMGKTFVATAIARKYWRPVIVAPAALAPMWKQAFRATQMEADFLSFERLSRIDSSGDSIRQKPGPRRLTLPPGGYDFVIIDEAHHARSRAARRYGQLKRLTRCARVLLLTATPIHNRLDDMSAILALFLGSRATTLIPSELGRCIVRREHAQVERLALIPKVLPVLALHISDDSGIVRELMTLPDPIPVHEGGLAGALIGRSLVHQWASSAAALHAAVRRRIARAAALIASLEAGAYPTERELRTWTFDDGALQLGFPELLSVPIPDTATLLERMTLHSDALVGFRARHSRHLLLDAERAELMLRIRNAHPDAKIVGFAQYSETASMLFRRLENVGGVAVLTAHGARVAGGGLSRKEALARFAPTASHAPRPALSDGIDLLLATDLLSEGVNLQDAEVVVHLDLPWTSARMEQRVGRVARMGSAHSQVHVYLLRPPASAAELLESEALVHRKWNIARRAVGSGFTSPLPTPPRASREIGGESITQLTEQLRGILESWRRSAPTLCDGTLLATVSSRQPGFISAVTLDGSAMLLVCLGAEVSGDPDTQVAACSFAGGPDVQSSCEDYNGALAAIGAWLEKQAGSALAGTIGSANVRRKRLLSRIDSSIERVAPHLRSSRLTVAARARSVAATQQSAAIEAELERLARSKEPDEEWLQAIAALEPRPRPASGPTSNRGPKVEALLLLRQPD